MRKKRLLEMPVLELTEEMCQKALGAKEEKVSLWSNKLRYDCNVFFRAAVDKGILQIAVYFTKHIRSGCIRPTYRIFFDKKADDFLTFDMEQQKWLTSRIDNLKWPDVYGDWRKGLSLEKKEEDCIVDYLGLESFKMLEYWQYTRRTEKRMRAIERQAGKWDAIMRNIPNLPKDWETWLAKNAVAEHYMFYEYKKGGKTSGRCSRCGKVQPLFRPKYNQKGVCKSCRHPVIYKSIGKCGRIWTKRYVAHILQRMNDGVVSRQFQVCAVYLKGEFDKPRLHCWEERRFLLDQNGNGKAYYYGEYKDRKMHWIETEISRREWKYYSHNPQYCSERGVIYKRTLPSLEKKELKKTGIWHMAKSGLPFAPECYLLAVRETPVIEKVAKAKLGRLALELVKKNENIILHNAGKLYHCLDIDRNQLKRLRANNGGIKFLKWLQYEGKLQKTIEDEVIAWFIREEMDAHDISFLKSRMNPKQVMNYLIKQQKKRPKESFSQVLSVWKDYLKMAKMCRFDVDDPIVYKATDLWKRHEETVQLLEEHKNEYREQDILEQYPNLPHIFAALKEKYSYQDETYAVIVPETVQDLISEGDTLHHCVNKTDNYFERIAKEETYILFLRRTSEPSVPYYTLEVEPGGTIRQKRTKYNRQNEDIEEASKFLKTWQRVVRNRMTEDDRTLAKRSRDLRMEKYEELRRDGIKIGQGTFGGQLLVDLLEADLMEMPEAA